MSLAAVILILAAVAAAQAMVALHKPDGRPELSVMAAILMIAAALILLDIATAAWLVTDPPMG